MKFNDVWRVVERQNPKLAKGRAVTMSTENFRKALQYAYDRGAEEKGSVNLFEGLFGKR